MLMVQLIALTDFSEVSKNAFWYGHALSRDLGGKLTLLHYYQEVKTTGHFKSMRDIMKEDAEREMELLINQDKDALVDSAIETKVVEGDVTMRLQTVKDTQNHLVVIGSSGATNRLASVFGSTAKALINSISLPTLIVPPNCTYKKPQTMVVANDGMMSESNLKYLDLVASKLGAHLYFLHIGDIDIDQKSIDRYSTFLKSSAYSFHNINAKDIIVGINKFADSVQADMVVMAKNKRNFLQKIFTTSHTNAELFHTVIPLFILHRDQ